MSNQENKAIKQKLVRERVKELTFVAAFPEKCRDNLSSGIISFDEQNPMCDPPQKPLPRPILLLHLSLLFLHLHVLLTTH